MFEPDEFCERAAIQEFDGGLTRFQAETAAARAQGVNRWEALGDVTKRIVERARHQREAMAQRAGEDAMSGMQSRTAEKG